MPQGMVGTHESMSSTKWTQWVFRKKEGLGRERKRRRHKVGRGNLGGVGGEYAQKALHACMKLSKK